jgi:hypothetical protein
MFVPASVFEDQLKAIAHRAVCANAGSFEPGDLHVRQGSDGELQLRLEQVQDREQIAGQQEAQDLPAAVGKLNVSVGPTRAKDENVLRGLIAGDDLFARASYLM